MKALLGKVLGPLIFRAATVSRVEDVAKGIRVVHLGSAALTSAPCVPGDKVQVFIPDVGMRTYTPVAWDRANGTFQLVLYLHGTATPGAKWAEALVAGAVVQFFGPRRSVRIEASQAPAVLFGDETSMGVALALRAVTQNLRVVLEAAAPAEVSDVLARSGLTTAEVIARDGERHFDRVVERLSAAFAASPAGHLILTGAAPSIQKVQKRLRASGIRAASTKAYWAPGKVGLD